jgi:hypothetical protein
MYFKESNLWKKVKKKRSKKRKEMEWAIAHILSEGFKRHGINAWLL